MWYSDEADCLQEWMFIKILQYFGLYRILMLQLPFHYIHRLLQPGAYYPETESCICPYFTLWCCKLLCFNKLNKKFVLFRLGFVDMNMVWLQQDGARFRMINDVLLYLQKEFCWTFMIIWNLMFLQQLQLNVGSFGLDCQRIWR